MNDSPGQFDAASVYVEALKATMPPEHFQLLGEMLRQTGADPEPQDPTVEHDIPPEVFREYAAIIAIMLTGEIDRPLVQTPKGSWVMFKDRDSDAATDPDKLAEMDAWAAAQRKRLGL